MQISRTEVMEILRPEKLHHSSLTDLGANGAAAMATDMGIYGLPRRLTGWRAKVSVPIAAGARISLLSVTRGPTRARDKSIESDMGSFHGMAGVGGK